MRRKRPAAFASIDLSVVVSCAVLALCAATGCAGAGGERTIDTGLVRVPLITVRTLERGRGSSPSFGDTVVVHVKARLPDGRTIIDTRAEGQAESFLMGRRDAIPGLELVVAEMHVGERCEARIPWQVAYGAAGTQVVPPRSDVTCEVELVQIRSR